MLLYRAGQASNALLWGLGNDSGMWNFVNRGDRTTFLENHSHWIAQVQAQIPGEHPGEIYERGWIWCAHTGEVERLDTIPCYARRAKPCVTEIYCSHGDIVARHLMAPYAWQASRHNT